MTDEDYLPDVVVVRRSFGELQQLFGKAFERSSAWMHLVAIFSAFASDFLRPLVPYCTIWLFVFALAIVAVSLYAARGAILQSETRTAVAVFFVITAIMSLGVMGLQRLEGNPSEGVLANSSATIRSFQKSLDVFAGKLDATSKILKQNTDASNRLSALLEETARDKGVPFPALQKILARLGKSSASADPGKIVQLLNEKADEYISIRTQLAQLSAEDPRARALQREAEAAFAQADFATARSKLHLAAEIDRAASKELVSRARIRAFSAAQSLSRSADIANVELQYRDAATDLGEAAELVLQHDRHAAWQFNLERGNALRHQGDEFGDSAALIDAINAFQYALTLISPSENAADWATTKDSLGLALSSLGQRDGDNAHLEESISTYREALKILPSDTVPLKRDKIQINLANALESLGEREKGTDTLELAASIYREVLSVQKKDREPLVWADTSGNLGVVLTMLGDRKNDVTLLEQAVDANRKALTVYTLDKQPFGWAATQNNLAASLANLGNHKSGVVEFQLAIVAFHEAMKIYTLKRDPSDWAMTQMDIGLVLDELGRRGAGFDQFKQSVDASRAALTEYTLKRDPFDWASVQTNLGDALCDLGERGHNIDQIEQAIAAYSAALTVFTTASAPHDREVASAGLARAQALWKTLKAHR